MVYIKTDVLAIYLDDDFLIILMKSISMDVLAGVRDKFSISEIAKSNKTTASFVSQVLATLVRQGYIQKYNLMSCNNCQIVDSCRVTPHKDGIRIYIITEKGKRYLDEKAR
jgi:hypothetical protein